MLYLYDLHLLDSYEHFMNSFKKHFLSFKIITDSEIDGKTIETVSDFFWGGAPKSLQMVTAAMKLKDAYSLKGKL